MSVSTAARASGLSLAGLALLLSLAVAWGSSWPVLKIAVAEIPILAMRTACMLAGIPALFVLAGMGGQPLSIPRRWWPRLAVASFFNIVMWNLLIPLGVQMLPAGRASVLFYTSPAWASLLAWVVLRERLSPRRLLGVALGLIAVAVLVGGDFAAVRAAPWGVLCILSGSMLWAAGAVTMKGFPANLPTTTLAAWQLVIGLPVFIAGFLVFERDALHPISGQAWAALIYTIAVGFVFGYWAWFRLVRMVPVAVSSVGSLTIPITAVVSAIWLTGERPGPAELIALALVAGAILAVALPEKR